MILPALYALLLWQSVVSIRPGFVHFVDGKTEVRKFEQLSPGKELQTSANSRIEVGLGPDALLRLDENSSAVLESLDSTDMAVRVESGTALIEVSDIEKPKHIRVTDGDLKVVLDSKGVFRFSMGSVAVIDGKLTIAGTNTIVQKGSQLTAADGDYKQNKLTLNTPPVFKAFLNAPKAGFVNAVHGDANVKATDTIRQDQTVQTGAGGYVEVLLRPGAFLRVDENSSIVLESTSANDVVVRVVSGDALLENIVPEDRLLLRVNIGGTKAIVASTGLYRLTADTVSVIDGILRFGKNGEAVFSGMQVHMVDKVYDTKDLDADSTPTGLDQWSVERSQLLSKANFIADFADSQPNFFIFFTDRSYNAAWLYSPTANGITFMPQLTRESHYGTSFVPSYPLLPGSSIIPPASVRASAPPPSLPVVTPASTSSSTTQAPKSPSK